MSNDLIPPRDELRYFHLLERVAPWLAGIAIFIAQYGLYLNLNGLNFTLRPYLGGAATTPATAACISLLCAGTLVYALKGPVWLYYGMTVLALLLAVVSFLPVGGVWAETDRQDWHGRMASDTYLMITLLGAAKLLRGCAYNAGAVLVVLAAVLLLNSFLGRSFGLPYFAGEMATATMLSFAFATAATMMKFMDFSPMKVLLMNTDIGSHTRQMVFAGVFVPWACGIVLYHGYGVPPRGHPAEAIVITVIILVTTINAIRGGNRLERADALRRTAEKELERLAVNDQLTGLLNREGLMRKFDEKWLGFFTQNKPVAVLMMDIDFFKRLNDRYGHSTGDQVLAAIGPALTPFLRKSDVLGRWGGEEFLILLEYNDLQDVAAIAERLRCAVLGLSHTIMAGKDDGPLRISASFGVSVVQHDDPDFGPAVSRADKALYEAKRAGRDKVMFDRSIEHAA